MAGKDEKPWRGLMYGALDESGGRVENSIQSGRIGEYAGLPNIERKCAENREYLRDLDRRKALAGRIRLAVSGYEYSQSEVERRLFEVGISAVFRHNEDGLLTGATFIDHRGKAVYNGSNLGKDLSANAWWARFNEPPKEQLARRKHRNGQHLLLPIRPRQTTRKT